MTVSLSARLDEQVYMVQASAIGALTTTVGDTTYVSMKGYARASIVIDVLNATTVTGGTVTLKQATAVAGTSEKALAFSRMLANIDVGAGQAMTETAVTSNTFTTDTTNSKRLRYIIDVDAEDLDVAGGFDCLRVDVTGMVSATGMVSYILYGARYAGASPMAD
jgi:hypothetical protein